MPNDEIDISEAVTLFLKHHPGKNDREFDEFYHPERAGDARAAVQAILHEAMSLRPDWSQMSLNESGDFVEAEMNSRHPELSAKALESIGNYFSCLMRSVAAWAQPDSPARVHATAA